MASDQRCHLGRFRESGASDEATDQQLPGTDCALASVTAALPSGVRGTGRSAQGDGKAVGCKLAPSCSI